MITRIDEFKKSLNESFKHSIELIDKIADRLFDVENDDTADDYEKVETYFSSLDADQMAKFADEVAMPRRFDVSDLMDINIIEWPLDAQNRAIDYLLTNGLMDNEGKWIGQTHNDVKKPIKHLTTFDLNPDDLEATADLVPEVKNILTKEDNDKLNIYFKEQEGEDFEPYEVTGLNLCAAANKIGPEDYERETLGHLIICLFGDKYDMEY